MIHARALSSLETGCHVRTGNDGVTIMYTAQNVRVGGIPGCTDFEEHSVLPHSKKSQAIIEQESVCGEMKPNQELFRTQLHTHTPPGEVLPSHAFQFSTCNHLQYVPRYCQAAWPVPYRERSSASIGLSPLDASRAQRSRHAVRQDKMWHITPVS